MEIEYIFFILKVLYSILNEYAISFNIRVSEYTACDGGRSVTLFLFVR